MENQKQNVPNMGEDASRVFSGEYFYQTTKDVYGETAEFFAGKIKENLAKRDTPPYTLADIGTFKGELLADVLKRLPEYKFKTIGVDINEGALQENKTADEKVLADSDRLPFGDKSIDIEIMRYVLQFNSAEKQKRILAEIARTVKEFALVEHVGADTEDTESWRKNMDDLLDGEEIPKMKREGHFFSSRDEIEGWMTEQRIRFKRIKDRRIENSADVYIERYALNEEEARKAREILGDKNYFWTTDWIIYPKE